MDAELRFAGVAPRALAVAIDFLAGGLPLYLVLSFAVGETGSDENGQWASLTWHQTMLWLLAWTLYYAVFEGSLGATPGKLALGLRVRQVDGSPIGYRAAFIRNVARFADAFPWVVPYVVAAAVVWTDKERQRLGDRAARTTVVWRRR